MQIRLGREKTLAGTFDVVIQHKTEELIYSITEEVIRTSQKYGFEHFEEINAYWAQIPIVQQDVIFDTYRKIYTVLNESSDIQSMTRALRPLVTLLSDLHPLDDLDYWIWLKSPLLVPTGIKRVFNPEEDTSWTREKTYLEDDYRKLVTLTLSMRALLPVWEEFILQTKKETGPTFKEYQAFDLISNAHVMSSEAMRRLEVFVVNTIPKDRSKEAAVFSGVSSEDFPEWILAVTVVKRLTSADIRGINSDHTLVTYLHNYIDQRSKSLENRTGKIKPKYNSESSGTDENSNHSKLEGFKIKEAIAEGDITSIRRYIALSIDQAYGREPATGLSLINRLSPDTDIARLIQMSCESTKVLFGEELTYHQITIAGWVLANYIPCESIPYLNKSDILSMIAISQAYLWSKGHYALAGLVSAVPRNYVDIGGNIIADSKTRMSGDNVTRFGQMFPYLKRTSSRAKNAKSTNTSLTSIDTVVEGISCYQWTLTLPPGWIAQLQGSETVIRFRIPENIRDLLAALVIELDNKDGSYLSTMSSSTLLKSMETIGI
jgi:hypothetical protein